MSVTLELQLLPVPGNYELVGMRNLTLPHQPLIAAGHIDLFVDEGDIDKPGELYNLLQAGEAVAVEVRMVEED